MLLEIFTFLLILVLISFYIGYQRGGWMRYRVKYIAYHIALLIIAAITIPPALFRPKKSENVRIPTWLLCRLNWFLQVDVVETRNIDILNTTKGPFVIVLNHQSSLDVYVYAHVWPSRCVTMIKKELLYAGTFGVAAWLCGAIPVDRLRPDKARNTIAETAKRIKDNNLIVMVFPEGTRYHGEGMLPFKKGAFNIAVQAQIPIVPLVISSYKPFMDASVSFFNKGEVMLSCLPPVDTTGLEYSDVTELAERIRGQMLSEFNSISKEMEQRMARTQKKVD